MLKQNNISSDKLLEIIKVQTEVVEQGIDLGSIMNLVTHKTRIITDAEGACVELIEKDQLVYSATSGKADKFLGLRLDVKNSLSGRCVEERHPLISNDIELDDRVNKQACRKINIRSMIVMPLIFNNTVVGVIKVFSSKTNCFNNEKIKILELMSGLIAAAMYSAIKNEKNELFYKATHDNLTGIPNRSLFYDRLRQRLSTSLEDYDVLGIIIIDMDDLKGINDILGHRAGDAAIKEVGLRIKNAIRKTDCVARLGGDEFGIITSTLNQTKDIEQLIKQIDYEITRPFKFEGNEISLNASMGYSILSKNRKEIDNIIEVLIEEADKSMYEMKKERKKYKSKYNT